MSAPDDKALFLTLLDGAGQPDPKRPPAELPRKGKLIIGSSEERADFVVTGQGISEVHCAIGRLKAGGWALKDMGSDFGTLVNGERIETARLEPDDELLIGSRKLRIVADATSVGPTQNDASAPGPSEPAAAPVAAARTADTPRSGGAVNIAGYRVDGELGRGAMGLVLRATQTSLDRKVAVKVLAPKLAGNATFVDRFRKEARAAAQLNHPNVVTVYDVGEEAGQHYLSMEYMDGGSVESHLSTKGRFHWREALGVLRDAAAGLVYAESRGIVHRDIKPDNLMRNADGATKIADLGLAVQVEQAHVDGERGKVFGTPHFLAPELARGATPDARSDIYSLGATAYRMISGRTPHEGSDPRSILRSVLNEEPPRLGALVQGLPEAVDELVHAMLAKDPNERTASAGFVVRQIDGIISGSSAAQETKSRGGLLAVVAVILAAAGGLALLGGDSSSDPTAPASRTEQDVAARGGFTEPVQADPTEPVEPATPEDPAAPDPAPAENDGDGETVVEDLAKAALLALEGEALSPSERSTRLKDLARKFAGTDTANEALERAAALDSGVAEERGAAEAYAGLRTGAIDALSALADPSSEAIRPGEALARVGAFEVPGELVDDAAFRKARGELIDALVARIPVIAAEAAGLANEAEARGEFRETIAPLSAALARCELNEGTETLLAAEKRPGFEEAREEIAGLRARLQGLKGREAEFAAVRQQRERAMVGEALGRSFRVQLGSLQLAEAADGSRLAAGLIRAEALRESVEETAEHLDAAARAMDALVSAWDEGTWRRRAVIDPRTDDADFTDVVGVARPAALLLPGNAGSPERVPLGAWASDPGQMENLFLRRLDRGWSEDETVGIVTLLCVSGTISGLEAIQPAIAGEGKRLKPSQIAAARNAFDEARTWADGRSALLQLVERHAAPMRMLADAVVAREQGDWLVSSELLDRLLEEERDSFVVMILSDGGAR